MDAYLASAKADATLVGGAGSAGYDGGFWIRGGSFLMKINLTLQTRLEGFDWDDTADEPSPGGDLSGFSLPRVTLKFSGDATCDVHYYAELEFGHAGTSGRQRDSGTPNFIGNRPGRRRRSAFIRGISTPPRTAPDYGVTREGWIEYEAAPAARVPHGPRQDARRRASS